MFCGDLVFATPEGVVLARPASTVRAGKERAVAQCLAELGVPILTTWRGTATFEGADAMWLNPATVAIGRGLRTNDEGARQVGRLIEDMGVDVIVADMPYGTIHLMGMVRIVDRDLAVVWQRCTPHRVVEALWERGFTTLAPPEGAEAERNRALNFVSPGAAPRADGLGQPRDAVLLRGPWDQVHDRRRSRAGQGRRGHRLSDRQAGTHAR
jgi:arginine deiminase